MKKYILILVVSFLSVTSISAHIICPQRLTPKEFNQKQKEFITTEANLTENESNAFFKLYFELQDKKRTNNQEVWELMRYAKGDLTEKEYEVTLTKIYQLRKNNADLDIIYFQKFKDIIPNKKVFEVLRAESKFQRQIIKGMHQHQKGNRNTRSNRSNK